MDVKKYEGTNFCHDYEVQPSCRHIDEALPPKWDVIEVGRYFTVTRVDEKHGDVAKLCVMYVGETEGRTLWFRTRETAQAIADALNEVR